MRGFVLVAGASGALGRHVIEELKRCGRRVKVLTRTPERLGALAEQVDAVHVGDALVPASLAGLCDGVDEVISSLGASVQPGTPGRATFAQVDTPANRHLIDAAKRSGVRKFVYISVFGAPERRDIGYLDAHERVVDALRESGLAWSVLRPTGFFSAFEEFLRLARKGPVPVFGGGEARSNPISDVDLAAACVDALANETLERDVGGPEVLTRNDIARLACEAVGVPLRVRRVPLAVARAAGVVLRPFHPRLSHLLAFYAMVMSGDHIAPVAGTRRLAEHFAAVAARGQPAIAGADAGCSTSPRA